MSESDLVARTDTEYLRRTHYVRTVQVGSRTHGGEREYAEQCGRCKESWPCSVTALLADNERLTAERDAAVARAEANERMAREANAECIRHWNRADAAEARLAQSEREWQRAADGLERGKREAEARAQRLTRAIEQAVADWNGYGTKGVGLTFDRLAAAASVVSETGEN